MKNAKIIEAIARTIWSDEIVDQMIENGEEIPLHTFAEWKRRLPTALLAQGATPHEAMLWFVNKKTGKPYKSKAFLYEKKDIYI